MGEDTAPESHGHRPARALVTAVPRLRGADVTALAAETAYYAILAVAPFLIFVIAGIAIISQIVPIGIVDDLENTVQRMAPGQTGDLLLPLFENAVNRAERGTTSISMITAIILATWSGSRAIGALLKGAARLGNREVTHSALRERIVSLALAIVMAVVLILSVSVFLFGGALARGIAGWIQAGEAFSYIWEVISWPLMALVVLLVLSVFYWVAAGSNTSRLNFISSGAIVATVLWLLIMAGMRVYLWIADPVSIYGVLASFILLVVFFFAMSLALLYGAAVNAEVQGAPDADQSPV